MEIKQENLHAQYKFWSSDFWQILIPEHETIYVTWTVQC